MRVSREETFGPVAPIMVVEDEAEAIQVANNSDFGLGGSIWTRDLDKAQKLSSELECGIVTVNNMVASDPRVPFGGIKHSGFGRNCPDMECLNLLMSSQSGSMINSSTSIM